MIDGPIDPADDEDPVDALARAFLERGQETASRYIGDLREGRGARRVACEHAHADGVIFAAASFCDPALLDQPMLEAALTRAPASLTRASSSPRTSGQFQTSSASRPAPSPTP